MSIFWTIALALCILFSFVLFVGAPYVPSLRREATLALDLLDLKAGQLLLELGAGDGRVAALAAKRGLRVVGVELNPLLALVAWVRTRRYGGRVRIVCGDFWRVQWPDDADAIFTFLLPRFMPRLDRRIESWHKKPILLASFAFAVPGKKPAKRKRDVYVYEYRP